MEIKEEQNQNNNVIYKEYMIKNSNDNYNLKIEINEEDVSIILKKMNNSLDYFYKNKIKKSELLEQLKLDESYKLKNFLILNILDQLYKENKIILQIIDNKLIKIKFENNINNINIEMLLVKENMTIDDKLNIIYNEIIANKHKDNNNNKYQIVNNSKFEFLNNKKSKSNSYLNANNNIEKKIEKNNIISREQKNNDYINLNKKVEEIDINQKKLLSCIENINQELKELKNIIINQKNNNQINIQENEIIQSINNNNDNNNNNVNDNDENNNDIEIVYNLDKDTIYNYNNYNNGNGTYIYILGGGFVSQNKNNYKIIANNEEYELKPEFFIDKNDKNRGYINIKLKNIIPTSDMSGMFSGVNTIKYIKKFDTSKVTNMSYMFYNCGNFQIFQIGIHQMLQI